MFFVTLAGDLLRPWLLFDVATQLIQHLFGALIPFLDLCAIHVFYPNGAKSNLKILIYSSQLWFSAHFFLLERQVFVCECLHFIEILNRHKACLLVFANG